MAARYATRWLAGVVIVIGTLAVMRYEPWQAWAAESDSEHLERVREQLTVGFLPVTCHLTCPVTDYASRKSKEFRYDAQRFNDFPTVAESMKSGRLEATFMTVPLAMKLREQGLPVKIVYLGHRDGSTVMVRPDLSIRGLEDLKGRRFAIPSKYSNQFLVIRKLMVDRGIDPASIDFVELPPPDMPGALAAKAIDAYFVGEPFPAKAELSGEGRILYHVKDIWPGFISCALVVHERLIHERPNVVANLVRSIAESGEWAETHRLEAAHVASPYFRQDEAIVRHVLTSPSGRVSYRMLSPSDADLQLIQDMALETGMLDKPVPLSELLDRRFIPRDIAQRDIVPELARNQTPAAD